MSKLTYDKAMTELQSILSELQDSDTKIDTLSKKIARSKELLTFCKTSLRKTEEELDSLMSEEG